MTRLSWLLVLPALACGNVKKGGGDGGPGDGDGAPAGKQRLSVTVTGGGTVTSDPPGIECPETCTADFDEGVEVTLTTTPNSDSGLASWGGDCSGLAATCALTMDASRTAEVVFDLHGAARWVAQISFPGSDMTQNDLALDGEGNPIIAGTVDQGEGRDLYVAKFDKVTGEMIWDTLIETPGAVENYGALAVDADGNAYAGARILGVEPVTIDGTEVTTDLVGNIFVVRLASATGDIEWVKQWGGGGQDELNGMAVLGTNLIAVGETSSSPCDFDGTSVSDADAFLVKIRLDNGNGVLAKGLVGNIHPLGVATGNGRIGIAGWFLGSPTIDAGCNITSAGTSSDDGFVAQFLPADLDCQWAKDFGDSAADNTASADAIAAYPGGGWVSTGGFEGNILFAESGTSLQSRGTYDAFAVRYADNGDHVWSFRYGDAGFDGGNAIATTPDGSTFVTGNFESTITFGGFELEGPDDAWVTRMSPGEAPAHEWAVALGGDENDRPEGLAVSPEGYVYTLAYFSGMTNVDGEVMTALGDDDGWLGALVP
ncbi:MAG TPA: hypothetical protein VFU21_06690 [Kofleriaceae bacterium]|nr:hypothetical protein [Kofleriaceae bacterium]